MLGRAFWLEPSERKMQYDYRAVRMRMASGLDGINIPDANGYALVLDGTGRILEQVR